MSKRNAFAVLAAAATAASLGIYSTARAVPTVDGTLDAEYGPAWSVQTLQTQFGDNQSELDAGYYKIEGGKLHLFLSGNLESNFNKMVIFFDTRSGGQNVMRSDNPDIDFNNLNTRYQGMTFDSGFSPDYTLFWSRDAGAAYLNFSELNTNGGGLGGYLGSVSTPNPFQQGSGTVGGGALPVVDFGYNDSNTAGVTGGNGPSDPVAAAAVSTGNEVVIPLPDIGATGDFKIMIGINGSSHDFWSNQFLPGLTPVGDPAVQGNLGSDGLGNFVPPGSVSAVNFETQVTGNQYLTIGYTAPTSQWADAGNGLWSDSSKWSSGVPNARDAQATLGTLGGSGAKTISLDTNVQVALLTIDSAGTYTVAAGGGSLTIAGNPATPSVVVNSGNHAIAAPVNLFTTTNFGIATGSSLVISGDVSATPGISVVKSGGGNLTLNNLRASSGFVSGGTMTIAANGGDAGASQVNTLGFDGGNTPTASLDLNDNDLVVNNGNLADVSAQIAAARNGGGWDANGLTSSAARNHPQGATTLGALAGIDYISVNGPTFSGFTVADDNVLVKYTWYGDTDFTGAVDFDDYVRTDAGFNGGLGGWFNGDFDLSGTIDFDDYVLIDLGFNVQNGTLRRAMDYIDGTDRSLAGMDAPSLEKVVEHFAQFGTDYGTHFLSAVPEPTSAAVLGLAAIGLTGIRRRRSAR